MHHPPTNIYNQITIANSNFRDEGHTIYELATFGERLAARLIDVVIIIIPFMFIPIPIIPSWLYWTLQHSSPNQATFGQRALGLKVVNLNGGQVGFGQATGRYFANLLNVLTLLIGYFLFFTNDRRQCLHDIISSCTVVKALPIQETGDNEIMKHLVE